MADIFVCMENIPIYFYEKFFHFNPLGAGQARSTRYQDFSNPRYIKMPERIGSKEIRREYEEILIEEMDNYGKVLEPTKEYLSKEFDIKDINDPCLNSRTFDTARYLLPLGVKSSFGILMTARKWSEAIALLTASEGVVDNEVGLLLKELLAPSKEWIPKDTYLKLLN
jgi:thymidylate synthase ThyX